MKINFEIVIIIVLVICQSYSFYIIKKKNIHIKKVMSLYEIGIKISSNIKLKKLMKEIMEIVKNEIGAEACSLYLIDQQKQELCFEVALGEKGNQVKEIRLNIGEGIAGKVAESGNAMNLKDVNNSPYFKNDIAKKIEFQQKSMLTMPVKYKDETIAVIQLINKVKGKYFTQNDEKLLEALAAHIATALENARLYDDMKNQFIDFINALISTIDAKDPYTKGHSKRVTEYSLAIAKEMGFQEEQLENLEYLAILHDVGKIGIKDSILNKQSPLDDEEYAEMKKHSIIGSKILFEMKSLKELAKGAKYHHERYDGTGYFEHLKGEEIPLEARIISIADTYDAMTTDRPYRKGLTHEEAMEEIERCAGTQFDPEIVNYFVIAMGKIKKQ